MTMFYARQASSLPPALVKLTGEKVPDSLRAALDTDATVVEADARDLSLEPAHAVLLFDVLQLLTIDEQDALLAELATRLDRGGVLLVREADASGGWRFAAVRLGNRLKQLVSGHWRQPFHPRTDAESWGGIVGLIWMTGYWATVLPLWVYCIVSVL